MAYGEKMTGESKEELEKRFRKETMVVDQSWIKEWEQGDYEIDLEEVKVIKTSSEPVKRLMYDFPPFCMVKAKIPLRIPQMGTIGIVVAYTEDNGGGIVVKQSPQSEFSAICEPGSLNVVGYYKGFTPIVVATHF